MRITSSEFNISAARAAQFPTSDMPEIAFVGRSNVGKSSLLNAILGRKNLAKTSSTPGKTRQINFFTVNNQFRFVDLPGYGYAKVSKEEREAWARLIEQYLQKRPQLRLVIALSDIRHEPTALDRSLFEWLEAIGQRFAIVLTKQDKISATQAQARVDEVSALAEEYGNCVAVLPVSSQTRFNCDRLLGLIGAEGVR